jgi:hypothetical protein
MLRGVFDILLIIMLATMIIHPSPSAAPSLPSSYVKFSDLWPQFPISMNVEDCRLPAPKLQRKK